MLNKAGSIGEYIKRCPENVQADLMKIHDTIMKAAPQATESISYAMPAYKLFGKPLVYFACFKTHIGFYAIPSAHAQFEKELSAYKRGKGSVQFPIDKPIPFELIGRITKFRAKEISFKQ